MSDASRGPVWSRLRRRAFAWADRFLPPGAAALDAEALRRARLTPLLVLAVLVWTPVFAYFYGPLRPAALCQQGCALLAVGCLWIQRLRSQRLAAHLLLGLYTAAIGALTLGGGGAESPLFSWFVATPMVAVLMLGEFGGVVWAGVTALCLAGVFGAEAAGWELPSTVSADVRLPLLVASLGGLTTILFCWALLLESSHAELAEALAGARDRAERVGAEKAQLLNTLSHEVRTPLNGLLGSAELLLARNPRPEDRELLEALAASGAALQALADGILHRARLEGGQGPGEPRPVELGPLLESAATALRSVARRKGIDLRVELAADCPKVVWSDEHYLRQVVLNLSGNAVKFTHRGEVVVSARRGPLPGRFTVEVRDTGEGIAPERLQKVFDPFSGSEDSTGLGLSIARRIVEELGGELKVESELGRGSRFWFSLPHGARPAAEADRTALGRALLADDDRVGRLVGRRFLEALGLEVDAVRDGREAVECARSRPYQVVFLDCDMPGLDGASAAAAIRAHSPAVPIVALTASSDPEDRSRCREAGMNAFLSKPISGDRLAEVLRELGVGVGSSPPLS